MGKLKYRDLLLYVCTPKPNVVPDTVKAHWSTPRKFNFLKSA